MDNLVDMNERDSLRIISEMIQKAKGSHFHENGTSAIMWGAVIGFCGIFGFLKRYYHWNIDFDEWTLALIAIIPQVYIGIKERRNRTVLSYEESAMNAVWLVYGISIFAMVFYLNVIPYATEQILSESGRKLMMQFSDGRLEAYEPNALSPLSLLMIIYAFPTLVTGITRKFKPMVWGAIACYALFIISLFTTQTYDSLLNGLAAVGNWLFPGLILRTKYLKARKSMHV